MSSTGRGAERREHDAYYTEDKLAKAIVGLFFDVAGKTVWEPHAGGGAFVRALLDAGADVEVSDIDPEAPAIRRYDGTVIDFLQARRDPLPWIMGNPPFKGFEDHIDHALSMATNAGFLLRLGAAESKGRIDCWKRWPLRKVWVLAERPSFTGGGTDSCAYGFFWFQRGYRGEAAIVPGWSWK